MSLSFEPDALRALAELLNSTGLSEIELEEGGRKLRLARVTDPGGTAAGFLYPGNQLAFDIRLAEVDREAEALGDFAAKGFQIVQGAGAVNSRLTGAQQIEIRAVEDRDKGCRHYRRVAQGFRFSQQTSYWRHGCVDRKP